MQMYYPTRRQDLLVGSLVSTLLISTAFWFGNGSHYVHVSTSTFTEMPRVRPLPPVEPETPIDIDEVQRTKPTPVVAPALPQLQDIPRPVTPIDITQRIEPPHPESNIRNVSVITNVGPGGDVGKVWEYGSLDRTPTPTVQGPPHYPSSMIQSGMKGEVLVDFIVDTSGEVRNATAVRSTNREFETSAVEAVSKWKFRPGMKGGRPVYTHMQVPIEFNLNAE
jgi:protein TonB